MEEGPRRERADQGTVPGARPGWLGVEARAESQRREGEGGGGAPAEARGGRGAPPGCQSAARRPRAAGAFRSLEFSTGEAARGSRGFAPAPAPGSGGRGAMVRGGSRELTILLGGRRLARTEKSVGSDGSPAGSSGGGGPATLGWGGCGPRDARGGRGVQAREGKRRRGERAGRGDWTRGSWRGEEKLRSRFRDGERGRRHGEKWRETEQGGRRGEGGQAARGCSLALVFAPAPDVTDSLQWLALTRNLKARKKGECRRGRGKRSAAARGAGGRGARGAGGGGGASASAAHPGILAHPLGGGCGGAWRALAGERGACRPPPACSGGSTG